MSALTFELKHMPDQRLDLSPLVPAKLAGLNRKEIEALQIGTTRQKLTVGDAFKVKGKDSNTLHFAGTDARCDKIGAQLSGGEIHVEGDVGAYLGTFMKSGKIAVRGSTGALAAASMAGGHIAIWRNVGDQACGVGVGDTMGMKGGFVTIGGNAGGRMIAGTLLLKRGAGRYAGFGNRRGSLIFTEKPRDILPTYSDCGVMEFDYLRLLEQWLRGQGMSIRLGAKARRLMGDMAVLGKGEMLILA